METIPFDLLCYASFNILLTAKHLACYVRKPKTIKKYKPTGRVLTRFNNGVISSPEDK